MHDVICPCFHRVKLPSPDGNAHIPAATHRSHTILRLFFCGPALWPGGNMAADDDIVMQGFVHKQGA